MSDLFRQRPSMLPAVCRDHSFEMVAVFARHLCVASSTRALGSSEPGKTDLCDGDYDAGEDLSWISGVEARLL